MTEIRNAESSRTVVRDAQDTELPPRYRVILLNDDYTTMEFVVETLEQVFRKRRREAVEIMLAVHRNGAGVAGVYVRQVAETKCAEVHRRARAEGFPLRCAMEPERPAN